MPVRDGLKGRIRFGLSLERKDHISEGLSTFFRNIIIKSPKLSRENRQPSNITQLLPLLFSRHPRSRSALTEPHPCHHSPPRRPLSAQFRHFAQAFPRRSEVVAAGRVVQAVCLPARGAGPRPVRAEERGSSRELGGKALICACQGQSSGKKAYRRVRSFSRALSFNTEPVDLIEPNRPL